jgi:hypothetical protein
MPTKVVKVGDVFDVVEELQQLSRMTPPAPEFKRELELRVARLGGVMGVDDLYHATFPQQRFKGELTPAARREFGELCEWVLAVQMFPIPVIAIRMLGVA